MELTEEQKMRRDKVTGAINLLLREVIEMKKIDSGAEIRLDDFSYQLIFDYPEWLGLFTTIRPMMKEDLDGSHLVSKHQHNLN